MISPASLRIGRPDWISQKDETICGGGLTIGHYASSRDQNPGGGADDSGVSDGLPAECEPVERDPLAGEIGLQRAGTPHIPAAAAKREAALQFAPVIGISLGVSSLIITAVQGVAEAPHGQRQRDHNQVIVGVPPSGAAARSSLSTYSKEM